MKIFKYVLALLALAMMPTLATAQGSVGQWILHSKYVTSEITNCIDAGSKVYYLSSGTLFCYDKETQENMVLDKSNYLNDSKVAQIYYNYAKKYLLVAYSNSNMDVILSDEQGGRIINMPDIKDAVMTIDRKINDVTFTTDRMLIATAFGYVVIDDTKWEVKESRVFNTSVQCVAEVGDYQILVVGTSYYYGNKSQRFEKLSDYRTLAGAVDQAHIERISDTKFFLCGNKMFGLRTIQPADDGSITIAATAIVAAKPVTVQPYSEGYVASFYPNNYYYTTDADGGTRKRVTGNEIYTSQEPGNWWVLGASGLAHIVDGVKSEYLKPNGMSMSAPVHLTYDPRVDKLYVSTTGANRIVGENQSATSVINVLQGDTWSDVTPKNLPDSSKYKTGMYFPLLDPDNPNKLYINSWWRGLLVVENGQYKFNYGTGTSSLPDVAVGNTVNYYNHISAMIDRSGNLWAVQTGRDGLHFLPAAKRGQLTTPTDWTKTNITPIDGNKACMRSFICTSGNIKIFNNGNYGSSYYFWRDSSNPNNIPYVTYSRFIDQDGKPVSWNYTSCLVEDKAGRVWWGTYKGGTSIGYFNPEDAFNTNTFTVVHPKVPRNDGTNMADYLLDAIEVYTIAVDNADRKWIGTNGDGVYVVNPDGSEVIEHFTMSNSGLPSDVVYEIACNTNTNSVYFATSNGFAEYKATAVEAASDYSNVVVYPNPVRPDFTGLITIKGLMANSLVKIADNAGNVVKQLQSEGGMVTWDGCNEAGDRVATGVYFVFASQGTSSSGNAAVSKILIVR